LLSDRSVSLNVSTLSAFLVKREIIAIVLREDVAATGSGRAPRNTLLSGRRVGAPGAHEGGVRGTRTPGGWTAAPSTSGASRSTSLRARASSARSRGPSGTRRRRSFATASSRTCSLWTPANWVSGRLPAERAGRVEPLVGSVQP